MRRLGLLSCPPKLENLQAGPKHTAYLVPSVLEGDHWCGNKCFKSPTSRLSVLTTDPTGYEGRKALCVPWPKTERPRGE